MKTPSLKKPFFAKFLTNQVTHTEEVSGGTCAVTKKYPSDNDESCDPIVVTLKFPSDNDEDSNIIAVESTTSSIGGSGKGGKKGRKKGKKNKKCW